MKRHSVLMDMTTPPKSSAHSANAPRSLSTVPSHPASTDHDLVLHTSSKRPEGLIGLVDRTGMSAVHWLTQAPFHVDLSGGQLLAHVGSVCLSVQELYARAASANRGLEGRPEVFVISNRRGRPSHNTDILVGLSHFSTGGRSPLERKDRIYSFF
ncbi:hypothetical protein NMY22_g7027 [Coprinellus aureogranulatus]|nr:hypothetical protein NMY22_g7027 [Coprinellus aureogranulatus]